VIPRIFHRIWLGAGVVPEEFVRYGKSWRRHHPAWEMREWTEESLPEGMRPEAYELDRNTAERADLIRYEILLRHGGVYVDMDFECLRPVEELLEDADLVVGYVSRETLGNAIIAVTPGHPAMDRAVREARPAAVGSVDKDGTGPGFLTALLADFPDARRIDVELLYPQESDDLSAAYAVHHEARTWRTHAELNETVKHLRGRLKELKRRVEARDVRIAELEAELEASERTGSDAQSTARGPIRLLRRRSWGGG
jgi:mannosyltransferase OCH1-like enzyme